MKYQVLANYMSTRVLTIEADSAEEAKKLAGEIVNEEEVDFNLHDVLSVHEMPKDVLDE